MAETPWQRINRELDAQIDWSRYRDGKAQLQFAINRTGKMQDLYNDEQSTNEHSELATQLKLKELAGFREVRYLSSMLKYLENAARRRSHEEEDIYLYHMKESAQRVDSLLDDCYALINASKTVMAVRPTS